MYVPDVSMGLSRNTRVTEHMSGKIAPAVEALKKGAMVLITDDTNNGTAHLMCPAARVTAEQVCTFANHGRGVLLAAASAERSDILSLPKNPQTIDGTGAEFQLSVAARRDIGTGASAQDRATTLQTLATTTNPRTDLVTPGHIYTVRTRAGGVLVRASVLEAATDLLTLSDETPVAAICQCLDETGAPLSFEQAQELATQLQICSVSLSDVICERLASETIVERIASSEMPIQGLGVFRAITYRSKLDGAEHLVLAKGELEQCDDQGKQIPIYTRVQAEHRIGDLLGVAPLDSRSRLNQSLEIIHNKGRGILLYIRHPRKGLVAHQVEQLNNGGKQTPPTVASQMREYGLGAQILKDLGAKRLVLLTNSTREIPGIDAFEIEITDRLPITEGAS